MTWIELTIDGRKLRIDSINWGLLQMLRDTGKKKPPEWYDCKMYGANSDTIRVEGRSYSLERIVYKAHNPEWSDHYSRRNIIMFINGETDDYSIENLMIKPTER